jgi:hypothetical protein
MQHQGVGARRKLGKGRVGAGLVAAEDHAAAARRDPERQRGDAVRHGQSGHAQAIGVEDDGRGVGTRRDDERRQGAAAGAQGRQRAAGAAQAFQEDVKARGAVAARRASQRQGRGAPIAKPEQRRQVGHVIGMQVADGHQHQVLDPCARLAEALEHASAGVDENGRPPPGPYQVAGRGLTGGEGAPGAEYLDRELAVGTGLRAGRDNGQQAQGERDDGDRRRSHV